jgi:hypothetical protein
MTASSSSSSSSSSPQKFKGSLENSESGSQKKPEINLGQGLITVTIFYKGRQIQEAQFNEFPVLIGRSADCGIRFPESQFISRQHSSISLNGEEIVIKDLGSTNGMKDDKGPIDLIRSPKKARFFIESLEFHVLLEEPERENNEVTNIRVIKEQEVPGEAPTPVTIAPFYMIDQVPPEKRALQAVLTWGEDIYSVHNFNQKEPILLGNKVTESIYLPFVTQSVHFGFFQGQQALIRLSSPEGWTLYRNKVGVSQDEILHSGLLSREKKTRNLILKIGVHDVLSLNLGHDLTLHFRFVKRPAYYLPKTLIENKEETQRALAVSALFHGVISLVVLMMTPQIQAPQIENVPPRVAKLLVEPPIQVIPPPPKPEPEPPPPEPEPEPPPPEPEKPKPKPPEPKVVKKEPPRPKPLPPPKAPPRPMAKVPPNPNPKPAAPTQNKPSPNPGSPVVNKNPSPKAPPQPTAEEKQAQELAAMLNQMPGPMAKGPGINKGPPIQIDKSRVSAGGIKVSGIASAASAIQQQQGVVGGGSPTGEGFSLGQGGKGQGTGGPIGFSKVGQTGQTGKRGVAGAVLGTPKLDSNSMPASQGLPNETVMLVVNRHLSEIQRCYERALFEDSTLAGRVEYEWNISPSGQVTSVRVVSSQMARSDQLNNCVMGVFKKMSFPKSTNGQPTIAKIGFPFGK